MEPGKFRKFVGIGLAATVLALAGCGSSSSGGGGSSGGSGTGSGTLLSSGATCGSAAIPTTGGVEDVVSTIPASGACNFTYAAPVGATGQPTNVTLFGTSGTETLVRADSTFSQTVACDRSDSGNSETPSDCLINSVPANMYFQVQGTSGDKFTILIPQPGIGAGTAATANQGSSGAPSVAGTTAGNDDSSLTVGTGTSYFSVAAIAQGSHTIAIGVSNASAKVALALFQDSSFTTGITCNPTPAVLNTAGGAPQDCSFTAPSAATVVYAKLTNTGTAGSAISMMMN